MNIILLAGKRYGKGQKHTGNGGVDTGLQHQEPHDRAADEVGQQSHDTQAVHDDEHAKCGKRTGKISDRQLGGVEQRDDNDGAKVVNDGKCRQEYFERGRDPAAQQRKHAQREGNICRHRNAEAGLSRRASIEVKMNAGGQSDAADGSKNGQQGIPEIGKLTVMKLPLQLQPDQQEEDCHQAVIHPVLNAQAGEVVMPDTQILRAQCRVGQGQ